MRVLWITNVELPPIARHYKRDTVLGGWMHNTATLISEYTDIQLSIACPRAYDKYNDITISEISYYGTKNCSVEYFRQLYNSIMPDLIHIWGTEYEHSNYAIKAANETLREHVVISIQGLVSIYYHHFNGGLTDKILLRKTIKEILLKPNLYAQKKNMYIRGIKEIETLKMAKNCIGRTDWDYACLNQINPDIKYYFGNEILRDIFYTTKWDITRCNKHSIFFSQAHYPIKGFHIFLQALAIVKRQYPDVKAYVIGEDVSKIDCIHISTYQKYIKRVISNLDLKENIIWVGKLNEEQMLKYYCMANVFVSSSSIENSSNSIGEAMLTGTPVIASDVGGIKSYFKHETDGLLYQFDAFYMLADCIIRIFKDDELALKFSQNSKITADVMFCREANIRNIRNIYNLIMEPHKYDN